MCLRPHSSRRRHVTLRNTEKTRMVGVKKVGRLCLIALILYRPTLCAICPTPTPLLQKTAGSERTSVGEGLQWLAVWHGHFRFRHENCSPSEQVPCLHPDLLLQCLLIISRVLIIPRVNLAAPQWGLFWKDSSG